jgi:hypothetical protein
MNLRFKIRADLLDRVRIDLRRRHWFAHERVGFITAGLCTFAGGVLAIARDYRPVDDDDYVDTPGVGAMMAPDAIRKAQERALFARDAIFHVHTHGGRGVPAFSGVDLRENVKFVPDFLKVAPHALHGAIVLSDDAALGQCWLTRGDAAVPLRDFTVVGPATTKWGRA